MHPEKRGGEEKKDQWAGHHWLEGRGTMNCALLLRVGTDLVDLHGCMSLWRGKKALEDRNCGRDRDGASDWCEREQNMH